VIKLVIKLAIAAFVANAVWRVGSAYATFYRFRDAVQQSTQFSRGRSEAELQQRIIDLAAEYEIPLAADGFTVSRVGDHTLTEGTYSEDIDFAPGVTRPWSFKWTTDTSVIVPPRLDPSAVK
jgi:hypothetical protein